MPCKFTIAVFGVAYMVLAPAHPPGDGDLYWQRWLGELLLKTHHLPTTLGSETFTASGSPWVPQEWLFSLLVAISSDHGIFNLFAILVGAIPAVILATILLRAHKRTPSHAAVTVALIFCGVAMANSFGVRAQIFGWGCLAAFMWTLEDPKLIYWCVPIVCLWANLHASVTLAPVLALARALGLVADTGWRSERSRRALLLAPLVAIATLASPLSWHLPTYSIELVASPIRAFIAEWQPTRFSDLSFTFGALPLFLATLLLGSRRLFISRADGFVFLILFAAMITANRNIPLFAIAIAPGAAYAIAKVTAAVKTAALETRLGRNVTIALCILTTVFMVLYVSTFGRNRERRRPALPLSAIASLEHIPGKHRLLCENFTWCSIPIGRKNVTVFIDGRADPYPISVWQAYMDIRNVHSDWASLLHKYGVDSLVVTRKGALGRALARKWNRVYDDDFFAVYVRPARAPGD